MVLDGAGKPSKRIGTYRDVTIEHEALAELKALAEKLKRSQETSIARSRFPARVATREI